MSYDQGGGMPPQGPGMPPGGPGPGYIPGYNGPGGGFVPVGSGEAISGAFGLYKKHFGAFFGFWVIATVITTGLSFFDGWMGSESMEYRTSPMSMIMSILNICLSFLFSAGIIHMTRLAMEEGDTKVGDGFSIITERGGTIIITSLVFSIILIIGFILCVIPGIIFCYWYFFAVTLVVVEGASVGEALSGSKRFSQDHGTFWFIVLLLLFMMMIYLVGTLGGLILGVFVFDDFFMGIIIAMVLMFVLQLFIAPVTYIATAYYYVKGTGRYQEQPEGY